MTFYKHNGVLLNSIFSKDDTDATNVTMTGFKQTTSLIYNNVNGSVSKQNIINYKATPTNYFANLSAYHVDYTQLGNTTISVNPKCTAIRVLLCGAGGSGGAGGGDSTGQRGMSGSGGGGGAYYYLNKPITTEFIFKIFVGRGGSPVSGSRSGNYGANGNDGEPTTIYYQDGTTVLARADGGMGGIGGSPDSTASGGAGASGGIGTSINPGNDGSPSTANRDNILVSPGGSSGWVLLKNGNAMYPKYSLMYPTNNYAETLSLNGPYGTGGAGSRGEYDPQTALSGGGEDGWARIYFIF